MHSGVLWRCVRRVSEQKHVEVGVEFLSDGVIIRGVGLQGRGGIRRVG